MTSVMMSILSVGLAADLPGQVSVSVGLTQSVADPFTVETGVPLQVTLGPDRAPWLSAGFGWTFFPDVDLPTELSSRLQVDWGVTPDRTLVRDLGRAELRLSTPWSALGPMQTSAGLHGGLALIHSQDDLEALHLSPEDAAGTANQHHLGAVLGVHADARIGASGLRVRLERTRWTETVGADTEEARDPLWIGAEYCLWL